MNDFELATRGVLEALAFREAGYVTWFGARVGTWGGQTTDWELARGLADTLYDRFYVHGGSRPMSGPATDPHAIDPDPVVHALRAANSSRFARLSGWRVVELHPPWVVVEREQLRLWVTSRDLDSDDRTDRTAGLPPLGSAVVLRAHPEQLRIAPGFYTALGEGELPVTARPMTRVYWHVTPAGAAHLVSALTKSLNGNGIGFRLKVVDRPNGFDRADSLVLYLDPEGWASASPLLERAHARGQDLLPTVPAYTKRLADGVGVAEDAGNGESFGQSRCLLLAESLVAAHRHGAKGDDERMAFVSEHLRAHGVDLRRPHLLGRDTDPYRQWDHR